MSEETINTETLNDNDNRKSGSGCGKILLWLFIIAILSSILCCAGMFGTGYYFVKALQKGYVDDPAIAQQETAKLFGEMTLPVNIKPKAFFTLNMFGKELGKAGIYEWAQEAKEAGVIVFYTLSDSMKSHETDFLQGVSKGITNSGNNFTVTKTDTIEITINGKSSPFSLSWAKNEKEETFVLVSGRFDSKAGIPCNIFITLPGEPTVDTIVPVLEKIQ